MICMWIILVLASALPNLSDSVKVIMEGSLTVGRDMTDTLKTFVEEGLHIVNRRRNLFLDDLETKTDSDTISLLVNAAFLCQNLEFCKDEKSKLINLYIISLTKSVERVFEGLVSDIDKKNNRSTAKNIIFEEELKQLIPKIKNILKDVNEKIAEDNESITWINLIKKINAIFQDRAFIFAAQRLEGNIKEITEVKKKLAQKLITAMTAVELKFESILCSVNNICSNSHECTSALNTLLAKLKSLPKDKAKEFLRHFYESLPSTNFYYRISDVTAHEFQSILHDMAYADSNVTINVLSTIHKTVEDRLNAVTTKFNKYEVLRMDIDAELVHVILSDMDYFYNKPKREPFHDFFTDFYNWAEDGGRFSSTIRHLMKDMQNMLAFEPDDLVLKLVNEVRVFMEITVDPPKT